MNVAGAQLHGFFKKIINGAHHRRAAGKIPQIVDVFFGASLRLCRLAIRRRVGRTQPAVERRGNVLERRDIHRHGAAEHQFDRLARRQIARIAERQPRRAIRRLIGKYRHFPKEPLRKQRAQRFGFDQLRQRQARQSRKSRKFIGEIMRRNIKRLPQLAQRCVRSLIHTSGSRGLPGEVFAK